MQSAQFWDKVARKYANDKIADMELYQKGLDMIKSQLSPTSTVVELGAGTSSTALILAPFTKRYQSTDISGEMVKIGREKLEVAGEDIQNRLGISIYDPSTQEWPNEKVDVVLGLNFLHLVPDVPVVVSRVHEMLEDDGIAIFKSACFSTPMKALFLPLVWILRQFGKAPHLNAFSFSEYKEYFSKAGFVIIDSYPVKKKALGHFIVVRKKTKAG